ncbi:MAG: prolipoprotein diacylglyceryl transferase [Mycoplasma sp.]
MNLFSGSNIQNTLIPFDDAFTTAFYLGDFGVKWYSIFFMIGFFVSICIGCAVCQTRYKVSYDIVFWFTLILIPTSIVGARFWSACIGDLKWENFFNFGSGGLAIQGGVIFSVIAALIYFPLILQKPKYHVQEVVDGKTYIRRPSMWIIADVMLPMILFGQAIGRWGNFFNGEVFGGEVSYESISWLGAIADKMQVVQGVTPGGDLYQLADGLNVNSFHAPLFFYEFLSNMSSWIVIYWCLPYIKQIKVGTIGSSYFIIYGITRFIMEPMRFNAFEFTGTYWLNGILLAVGVISLIMAQFICPKYRTQSMLETIWIKHIRFGYIKMIIKMKTKGSEKYLLNDPELKNYGSIKPHNFDRTESGIYYYGNR